MGPTTIGRKQLFEEVWATPMTILARKYGFTDVGLAKACRRHNIPRPPRGHWTKAQYGKTPSRCELINPEQDDQIWVGGGRSTEVVRSSPFAVEIPPYVGPPIVVKPILSRPHSLVGDTLMLLQELSVGEDGLISCNRFPIALIVSKSNLNRALFIYDALLKGIEARGYRLTEGPRVAAFGVQLQFEVREYLRYGHDRTLVPSGKLELRISGRQ